MIKHILKIIAIIAIGVAFFDFEVYQIENRNLYYAADLVSYEYAKYETINQDTRNYLSENNIQFKLISTTDSNNEKIIEYTLLKTLTNRFILIDKKEISLTRKVIVGMIV